VTLYSAYVILQAPAKKLGAVGIAAVLTASTFLACHEIYTGDATTFGLSSTGGPVASTIGIQYLSALSLHTCTRLQLTSAHLRSLQAVHKQHRPRTHEQVCWFADERGPDGPRADLLFRWPRHRVRGASHWGVD